MATFQIVLFSAAITVVFTQGEIFKFLRRGPWIWRELVSCALCSGVWIGGATYALSSGFPHAGDNLTAIFSSVFRLLGVASSTGCLALLFVAVWEKLDEPARSTVEIRSAQMSVTNPEISTPNVRIVPEGYNEPVTDPMTVDSRLTKKVPIDELRVEASRRSLPGEDK